MCRSRLCISQAASDEGCVEASKQGLQERLMARDVQSRFAGGFLPFVPAQPPHGLSGQLLRLRSARQPGPGARAQLVARCLPLQPAPPTFPLPARPLWFLDLALRPVLNQNDFIVPTPCPCPGLCFGRVVWAGSGLIKRRFCSFWLSGMHFVCFRLGAGCMLYLKDDNCIWRTHLREHSVRTARGAAQ